MALESEAGREREHTASGKNKDSEGQRKEIEERLRCEMGKEKSLTESESRGKKKKWESGDVKGMRDEMAGRGKREERRWRERREESKFFFLQRKHKAPIPC